MAFHDCKALRYVILQNLDLPRIIVACDSFSHCDNLYSLREVRQYQFKTERRNVVISSYRGLPIHIECGNACIVPTCLIIVLSYPLSF